MVQRFVEVIFIDLILRLHYKLVFGFIDYFFNGKVEKIFQFFEIIFTAALFFLLLLYKNTIKYLLFCINFS